MQNEKYDVHRSLEKLVKNFLNLIEFNRLKISSIIPSIEHIENHLNILQNDMQTFLNRTLKQSYVDKIEKSSKCIMEEIATLNENFPRRENELLTEIDKIKKNIKTLIDAYHQRIKNIKSTVQKWLTLSVVLSSLILAVAFDKSLNKTSFFYLGKYSFKAIHLIALAIVIAGIIFVIFSSKIITKMVRRSSKFVEFMNAKMILLKDLELDFKSIDDNILKFENLFKEINTCTLFLNEINSDNYESSISDCQKLIESITHIIEPLNFIKNLNYKNWNLNMKHSKSWTNNWAISS
ncbi:unnamed protein product [Brachionus calyciflorus]|uniref:Uncharacterized protein n=1 Tax=Brachionus calyciflorus TaxID=104777 RepID=A0A813YFF0_9BILA|nr:unnamed protein product [Brachionus calyciflorus]